MKHISLLTLISIFFCFLAVSQSLVGTYGTFTYALSNKSQHVNVSVNAPVDVAASMYASTNCLYNSRNNFVVSSSRAWTHCHGVSIYNLTQLQTGWAQFTQAESHLMDHHWSQSQWDEYSDKAGIKTVEQACAAYSLFQYPGYVHYIQEKFNIISPGHYATEYELALQKQCDTIRTDLALHKQVANIKACGGGEILSGILREEKNAQFQVSYRRAHAGQSQKTAANTKKTNLRDFFSKTTKSCRKAQEIIAEQGITIPEKKQQVLDIVLQKESASLEEYAGCREVCRSAQNLLAAEQTIEEGELVKSRNYDTHHEQLQTNLVNAGVDNTFDTCVGTQLQQQTHIDQIVLLNNLSNICNDCTIDTDLRDAACETIGLVDIARDVNQSGDVTTAIALQDGNWRIYDYIHKVAHSGTKVAAQTVKNFVHAVKIGYDSFLGTAQERDLAHQEIIQGLKQLGQATESMLKLTLRAMEQDCQNDLPAITTRWLGLQKELSFDEQFPASAVVGQMCAAFDYAWAIKDGPERAGMLTEFFAGFAADMLLGEAMFGVARAGCSLLAQQYRLAGDIIKCSEFMQKAARLGECIQDALHGALEGAKAQEALALAGETLHNLTSLQLRECLKDARKAVQGALQGLKDERVVVAAGDGAVNVPAMELRGLENGGNAVKDGAGVARDLKKVSELTTVREVSWTNHGFKHFPSKNIAWKDIIAATKSGAAKYHPNVFIEKIERLVWENGKSCTNGKPWKVMKFDHVVGASSGVETTCIRVEYSANTIHGHPITISEYTKLIG